MGLDARCNHCRLSWGRALGLTVATLAVSHPSDGLAQTAGPLRLSGSFGVTARGYRAAGIANRRAPGAVEVSANTNFSVFGLSSGFRLTYSTDQSGLRQSVNRFSFQTDWANGRIAAVDVSPDYSTYSVRGSTVRGGLVEWRPLGIFFGVSGGRVRRAIEVASALDPRGSVFARWIGAARVGVGAAEQSHFHVIGVYSRDAGSSLSEPGELTPHANLSVTPDFALAFVDNRVRIRGSATVSTVSKDSESSMPQIHHLAISDDPDIRTTYASEVEAGFNVGRVGLDAAFQRVMPGFESHGLTQIRSDEQTIRVAPRLTFGQGRVTLAASGARTNTNLLDDQLSTIYRDMATLTAALRISARFTLSANYAGMRNSVEPTDGAPSDYVEQRQIGHNVVVTPVLLVGSPSGVMQTIAVNASWQTFSDRSEDVLNGLREGFESTNRSLMLTYTVRLTPALSTSVSGGLVRSDAHTSESTITTANLGLSYRVSANWTSNVSAGWARNAMESTSGDMTISSSTERLSGSFGTAYSLTSSDAVRFDLRGSRNEMGDDAPSFREATATLSYTHRF